MPVAVTRFGNQYIKEINFSLTHGATPSTCELLTESQAVPAWGQDIIVQVVPGSEWRGRIVDVQDIKGEGKGLISRFRAIDYRDDLFGVLFFAQINMIDSNTGEIYQISEDVDPDGWAFQIPIYGHIYARDLIEVIAAKANFTCQFTAATLDILQDSAGDDWINSRYNIFNLDWNTGVKCSAALSQVCERLGLQFTILMNTQNHILRFTVIGEPDISLAWQGIFAAETVIGNAIQPDVDTGVFIVGDRNLHEYVDLPLVPAWNQLWTPYLLEPGSLLSALNSLGLDILSSKVSEFLFDDGFVEFGKFFNDMTIIDYIQTVPLKVYRIPAALMLQYISSDEYFGDRVVRQDALTTPLLSDPGTPFTVKCSHITRTQKTPKNPLQVSQVIKEKRSGIRLQEKTGHVIFDQYQYKLSAAQIANPTKILTADDIVADEPTIQCVFNGPIYRKFFGTTERVGSKPVSGLRIARVGITEFDDPEDVAEYTYPGEKPADRVAEDVALGYLTRPRVVRSGEETFIGTAGHFPNGEIHRVSVSVSDGPGIVERVSYSNDEPALEYDSQIELNRKIGVDQVARSQDKIRTDRRIADLKKDQAKANLLATEGNPLVEAVIGALNKDNYIVVQNPASQSFEAGDPIVAAPDGNDNFAVMATGDVEDDDTRITAIAMQGTAGETVHAISAGIAQANVEGPVVIGDQLVLNKATGKLKAGDGGNLTALQDQPDAAATLIPVRFGGGGSGGGGGADTIGNVSARLGSTVNVSPLSGIGPTVDGIAAIEGDTLLLKDQTNAVENGPWNTGYTRSVTAKERTANIATLTTSIAHGFTAGQIVAVTGLSGGFNNAAATITAVPSPTTFSYSNAGADVGPTAESGSARLNWVRFDLVPGMLVSVRTGKVNAGTVFELVTEGPIVPGSTALTFHKVNNDVAHRATAAAITFAALTGVAVSIDGAVATLNQIVLVKNCTTASANGLYRVQSGAWIYIGQPSFVFVLAGTKNARTAWLLTTTDTYMRWLSDASIVIAVAGGTGVPSGGTIDGIVIASGDRVLCTTGGTNVRGTYIYDGAAYAFEFTPPCVVVQRGLALGRRIWTDNASSAYVQTRGVYA